MSRNFDEAFDSFLAGSDSDEEIDFEYGSPFQGTTVPGGRYGAPRPGRQHNGIDLAGREGSDIIAPAPLEITFAGQRGGYGNLVIGKDPQGREHYFGHQSQLTVKPGERYEAGKPIGKVGSTGRSSGPHLHWEVRENGKPLDPSTVVGTRGKGRFKKSEASQTFDDQLNSFLGDTENESTEKVPDTNVTISGNDSTSTGEPSSGVLPDNELDKLRNLDEKRYDTDPQYKAEIDAIVKQGSNKVAPGFEKVETFATFNEDDGTQRTDENTAGINLQNQREAERPHALNYRKSLLESFPQMGDAIRDLDKQFFPQGKNTKDYDEKAYYNALENIARESVIEIPVDAPGAITPDEANAAVDRAYFGNENDPFRRERKEFFNKTHGAKPFSPGLVDTPTAKDAGLLSEEGQLLDTASAQAAISDTKNYRQDPRTGQWYLRVITDPKAKLEAHEIKKNWDAYNFISAADEFEKAGQTETANAFREYGQRKLFKSQRDEELKAQAQQFLDSPETASEEFYRTSGLDTIFDALPFVNNSQEARESVSRQIQDTSMEDYLETYYGYDARKDYAGADPIERLKLIWGHALSSVYKGRTLEANKFTTAKGLTDEQRKHRTGVLGTYENQVGLTGIIPSLAVGLAKYKIAGTVAKGLLGGFLGRVAAGEIEGGNTLLNTVARAYTASPRFRALLDSPLVQDVISGVGTGVVRTGLEVPGMIDSERSFKESLAGIVSRTVENAISDGFLIGGQGPFERGLQDFGPFGHTLGGSLGNLFTGEVMRQAQGQEGGWLDMLTDAALPLVISSHGIDPNHIRSLLDGNGSALGKISKYHFDAMVRNPEQYIDLNRRGEKVFGALANLKQYAETMAPEQVQQAIADIAASEKDPTLAEILPILFENNTQKQLEETAKTYSNLAANGERLMADHVFLKTAGERAVAEATREFTTADRAAIEQEQNVNAATKAVEEAALQLDPNTPDSPAQAQANLRNLELGFATENNKPLPSNYGDARAIINDNLNRAQQEVEARSLRAEEESQKFKELHEIREQKRAELEKARQLKESHKERIKELEIKAKEREVQKQEQAKAEKEVVLKAHETIISKDAESAKALDKELESVEKPEEPAKGKERISLDIDGSKHELDVSPELAKEYREAQAEVARKRADIDANAHLSGSKAENDAGVNKIAIGRKRQLGVEWAKQKREFLKRANNEAGQAKQKVSDSVGEKPDNTTASPKVETGKSESKLTESPIFKAQTTRERLYTTARGALEKAGRSIDAETEKHLKAAAKTVDTMSKYVADKLGNDKAPEELEKIIFGEKGIEGFIRGVEEGKLTDEGFVNKDGNVHKGKYQDGIIHVTKAADVSTFVHEAGHAFRELLPESDIAILDKFLTEYGNANPNKIIAALGKSGTVELGKWNPAKEELFTALLEGHLRTSELPENASHEVTEIFGKLRDLFSKVYKILTDTHLIDSKDVNPEVREFLDQFLLGKGQKANVETPAKNKVTPQTAEPVKPRTPLDDTRDAYVSAVENNADPSAMAYHRAQFVNDFQTANPNATMADAITHLSENVTHEKFWENEADALVREGGLKKGYKSRTALVEAGKEAARLNAEVKRLEKQAREQGLLQPIVPDPKQEFKLTDIEKVPVDENYVYHVTSDVNASDIATTLLDIHRPDYGTEQDFWPDGSTEKRSYWANKPLSHFAPENGNPVVLRVRRDKGEFKPEKGTGDIVTNKKILARNVEIYDGERGWIPVTQAFGNHPTRRNDQPTLFQPAPPKRTEEFNKWFGDSKAVDENGEPKIYYHGNATDVEFLKPNNLSGIQPAIFLSPDPEKSSQYAMARGDGTKSGAQVYPVVVRSEKPFDFRNTDHLDQLYTWLKSQKGMSEPEAKFITYGQVKDGYWKDVQQPWVQKFIKTNGFDSFHEWYGGKSEIGLAVFDSNQVKSVYNKGEFSRTDDRILFSPVARYSSHAQKLLEKIETEQGKTLRKHTMVKRFANGEFKKDERRILGLYDGIGLSSRDVARTMLGKRKRGTSEEEYNKQVEALRMQVQRVAENAGVLRDKSQAAKGGRSGAQQYGRHSWYATNDGRQAKSLSTYELVHMWALDNGQLPGVKEWTKNTIKLPTGQETDFIEVHNIDGKPVVVINEIGRDFNKEDKARLNALYQKRRIRNTAFKRYFRTQAGRDAILQALDADGIEHNLPDNFKVKVENTTKNKIFSRLSLAGFEHISNNTEFIPNTNRGEDEETAQQRGINIIRRYAKEEGGLFQPVPAKAPAFYSLLERTGEKIFSNAKSVQADSLLNQLKKNGVTKDELADTKTIEFLEENRGKKITAEDWRNHVETNKPNIIETYLGKTIPLEWKESIDDETQQRMFSAQDKSGNQFDIVEREDSDVVDVYLNGDKFRTSTWRDIDLETAKKTVESEYSEDTQPAYYSGSGYTTSGAEPNTYREILFSVPYGSDYEMGLAEQFEKEALQEGATESDLGFLERNWETPAATELAKSKFPNSYKKYMSKMDKSADVYRGEHFDRHGRGMFAHLRVQDRAIDGKRYLEIVELQSDWHQLGKKIGYKGGPEEKARQKEINELRTKLDSLPTLTELLPRIANGDQEAIRIRNEERRPLQERLRVLEYQNGVEGVPNPGTNAVVPDAPFKNNWHEFGLKRAIREAVEQGYDGVILAGAKTHIDRWGTQVAQWKRVNEIKDYGYVIVEGINGFDIRDSKTSELIDSGYKTREEAQKQIDDNKDTDDKILPHFLLTWGSQSGGNVGGIDLENEANLRGYNQQEADIPIRSEEDIVNFLKNDSTVDQEDVKPIASRLWKKMQASEEGIYKPRQEGMLATYGNTYKNYLAKLAKKHGAEFSDIEMDSGKEGEKVYTGPDYTLEEFNDAVKDWETSHETDYYSSDMRRYVRNVRTRLTHGESFHSIVAVYPEVLALLPEGDFTEKTDTIGAHKLELSDTLKDTALNQGFPLYQPANKGNALLQQLAQAQQNARQANANIGAAYANARKRTILDAIDAYTKANLLSGPSTHVTNVTSNAIEAMVRAAATLPAGAFDLAYMRFLGSDMRTATASLKPYGKALKQFVKEVDAMKDPKTGEVKEFNKAVFRRAWEQAKSGVSEKWQSGNTQDKLELPKSIEWSRPAWTAVETYSSVIFGALGFEDAVFNTIAMRVSLDDQARAMGMNLAKQNGTDWHSEYEKLIYDPSQEMINTAVAEAALATFQQSTAAHRAVTGLKNVIAEIDYLGPAGTFVINQLLPFSKTPSAIVSNTIDLMGGGFVRSAANLAKAKEKIKDGALKTAIGQREIFDLQRKAAKSSGYATIGGVFWIGLLLGLQDCIKERINPDTQRSKAKLSDLEGMGYTGGRIRIGGYSFDLRTAGPEGLMLLAGKEIGNAIKNNDGGWNKISGALLASTKTALEIPALKAAVDLNEVIEANPEDQSRMVDRAASNFAQSQIYRTIPLAGMMAQIAKYRDDYEREAKTVMEKIQAGIPGKRNQLPTKMDPTTGEKMERKTRPDITGTVLDAVVPFAPQKVRVQNDAVVREIVSVGIHPPNLRKRNNESEDDFQSRRKARIAEWRRVISEAIAQPEYAQLPPPPKTPYPPTPKDEDPPEPRDKREFLKAYLRDNAEYEEE